VPHFFLGAARRKNHMNQAAFEHDGAPIARERFYQIACDPRRSVAVEACAGAGKTWMLVSRMVRALLEGCAPQDILAITFTKKAAGEMRQRLQEWLHAFASASDATLQQELRLRGMAQTATAAQLQTLRGMHAALLQSGRPVQVRTFHSWFAALLRTAPLGVLHALGLPIAYQLLEDDKKATVLVWRRFQTRVSADPQARADYADAVAAYGRFNAQKALASALSKRTEFALADAHGVVNQSVATFAQQFPDFAMFDTPGQALHSTVNRALLQRAASVLGQQKGVTCQKAASALERALTEQDEAGMFAALLTQKGEARKLGDKYAGADAVQAAQELLVRLGQVQLQHGAWLHQQRMARLSRGLLADYAHLKREHGWIDMGDLEMAALKLLSDEELSGWIQERLDARVRHLLIDEFQDTNPLQWQALHAWLAGYAGAGNAPAVFIVGDPKQSIYRFRRAEPQVFRAAKDFVKFGLGGAVLSCDHTRRNATAIIGAVNAVMLAAQERQEFDGFRAHSTESTESGQVLQLPPIPQEARIASESRQHWRDSLTEPRFEEEDSRKVLECRQAACWLQARLQDSAGSLAPQDVMVLARKRVSLGLLQAELAALQIPAQQPEKNDLMDFAEVQDLVALLDALVSPRHDIALARALKSPLFGVSDADLVQLVLQLRRAQVMAPADTPDCWMQVLQSGASLPATLLAAAEKLTLWKTWVLQQPPHDALSAIYLSGDVLARFAAAAPEGMRAGVVANLNALLHAALALDGGRYSTAYSLVRALRAGGNAAPVRSDSHAVRLLTIHGAKGLEAPLVLMLDTDARDPSAQTMDALVDWPGEAAYPRRFVFLASETRPPACVADALSAEQAARSREELNALYVALTRTQSTLVLSSMQPRNPNPASWWGRLAAHPQAVESAPELLSAASTSPEVTSFDLLALPELPAAARLGERAKFFTSGITPDAAPALDSDDSRVGQAMHRLLEWLPVRSGAYGNDTGPVLSRWSKLQMEVAALQFNLDSAQMAQAARMAEAIVTGDGSWAWDAEHLQWHQNEVPISWGGRLLRIDRLVQTRRDGQWWVLDYKSKAAPQLDADLCAQLMGYRAAVAQATPGQLIRAAFLTPQGALIEINTP
jgi:ATP-dependent helicase/nuclease subunit A